MDESVVAGIKFAGELKIFRVGIDTFLKKGIIEAFDTGGRKNEVW